MSYTTAQLTAIQTAYANGILEATLPDGSKVRYRSLPEMERVILAIKAELGVTASRKNVVYPSHSRGF